MGERKGRLDRGGEKGRVQIVSEKLRVVDDESVASSKLILFASCGSRGWYSDIFARRNQEHRNRKITNNEEDDELIPEDDNRGSNVSRSSIARFCLIKGLAATIL